EPGAAEGRQRRNGDALKFYFTFARSERAADHADERGLAGAIGSDQTENFAGGQRKTDIADRDESCESPGQISNVEQRTHSRWARMFCMKYRQPVRGTLRTMSKSPRGISTMATTMTTPKKMPAMWVALLASNSEMAESENAPTTGPRTVP